MSVTELSSPYRGLAPFEDSDTDARLFFGRERERTVILANLMASRLTVLYGASGVGKSSLLGAGVAHELGKTDNVAVLRSWADDPIAALVATADRVEEGAEMYVILDQLEEFFLYHGTNGPASELAETLAELFRRTDVRVSALLGIREDSLAKLDAFKPRLPDVLANYLRLEHLDRDAARGAITEPLRRFEELGGERLVIEAALVEAVLDEVSAGRIDGGAAPAGRIETPYLQLVMQRLWEVEREEGSSVLRLETLRKLGGAERIVREHLELALVALTPAEQDAAARMFDHLVTPSGAKVAHHVDDLASYAGVGAAAACGVISRLEDERIVRPIEEGRVEIYHDVLGEPIATWRRDYEATRELGRARRRSRRLAAVAAGSVVALVIVSAVAVYALSQRSKAQEKSALAQTAKAHALAEKRDADEQRRIAQRKTRDANDAKRVAVEQATLARRKQVEADASASEAVESEEIANDALARARKSARDANASKADAQHARATAVTNLEDARLARRTATANARRANQSAETARQQKDHARARLLVAHSQDGLNIDSERSIKEALEASRLEHSHLTEDALRDALASFRLEEVFLASVPPVSRRSLLSVDRSLRAAVFSHGYAGNDSRYVATAGPGGVRLFDVHSAKRIRAFKPIVDANTVSFSSDDTSLVVGTREGTVLLWNVRSGALLKILRHPGVVTDAEFTSDDDMVVTGGTDGFVRLWEPASGLQGTPIDVGAPVRSLSLQPGGRLAAVVTQKDSARVVDLVTGDIVADLDQPGGIIVASFSPKGDVVVAGGGRGDGYIWDTRSWDLRTLKGHSAAITDISFTPDNTRVMTTSADTNARLWTISTGKLSFTFTGLHQGALTGGDISSRGDGYLTASADGTVGLWTDGPQSEPVVLAAHAGRATDATFSPDGWHVLTLSSDGNVRVWRARDPALDLVVNQSERATRSAFSPSGARLVTAAAGGTGRVYTSKGVLLKTLALGSAAVTDIAISDSGWFVTAAEDGTARVWRPDGSARSTLSHGSPIRTIAITPDGRYIATGGDDKRVVVFGRSGNVVRELAQGAPVTSVEFRSAKMLASGGADGSVKVWSLPGGAGDRSLPPHQAAVNDLSFSPRGLLATASDDQTAHVYDVRTGTLVRALQGHPSPVNVVLFSPGGQKLLTASTDGDVGNLRIWSAKDDWKKWVVLRGRRPPEEGAHHSGAINEARFSRDGRWILTAGPSAAGIWHARTGGLLYFVRGHQNAVRAVTFAPDNKRVLTAGADGTFRSYSCDLCSKFSTLQKFARARLALAARGRH